MYRFEDIIKDQILGCSYDLIYYSQGMYTILTTLLKQYKLFPKDILALGDTSIDWLQLWWSSHQVWWVVSSRDLVDQAKQILPLAKYYAQKLDAFRITGSAQLSYMLDQQINTIPVSKRDKVIATIAKHTDPYGLIVIDLMLPTYYDELSKQWGSTTITDHKLSITTRQSKRSTYIHHDLSFELVDEAQWLYHKTDITQQYDTMNLSDIKKLLSKYCDSIQVVDSKWRKLSKPKDHIVLVCQMWWPDWKAKVIV